METETDCSSGDCPTVGVDAVSLDRFAAIDTGGPELLIYDRNGEDAWIQSDVYFGHETCI
ncbi:hypothetical protein KY092_08500 [Natronomonas gomsonensis]|jgi:hypothetical protein|uniref:hypothetical protein n=1 Tax=Natronomonas gomsonensis TaxID=1046043 RepID=UPI0020CA31F6|nr:hypothetical protein [Natronomonas gomsonensis]MCY4730597.1 hypothetical protein [Natronomonas gomsonensis]